MRKGGRLQGDVLRDLSLDRMKRGFAKEVEELEFAVGKVAGEFARSYLCENFPLSCNFIAAMKSSLKRNQRFSADMRSMSSGPAMNGFCYPRMGKLSG
ncbi:Protein of unknown function, partial [Gryllus bimaculatus]